LVSIVGIINICVFPYNTKKLKIIIVKTNVR
jgi:hypothetical protein